MDVQRYLIYFVIITAFGILYNKWETKNIKQKHELNVQHIKQFLLNKQPTTDIDINSKPFLWIHVESDINSRNWESFNSRSNREVNKPYMFYTIKSIITKCEKTFNIFLIDDSSFDKLINDWNINLKRVDVTTRNKIRDYALAKILYIYGGVMVPPSFLCMKNLKDLYYRNINKKGMFVCEKVDDTAYVTQTRYVPDNSFMGCKRNSPLMLEYMKFYETMISNDYTSESNFKDTPNKYLSNMVNDKKISLVEGKMIGIKDINNNLIKINNLFETKYIEFEDEFYGIYIPDKEISKRTNYNWFLRLSIQDLLESEMIISKYMLDSNE